jgi:hypothetical protein
VNSSPNLNSKATEPNIYDNAPAICFKDIYQQRAKSEFKNLALGAYEYVKIIFVHHISPLHKLT